MAWTHWGINLNEFVSVEPNIDTESGITNERLYILQDLYQKQRIRDLKEQGSAMALAYHEPDKLKTLGDQAKIISLEDVPAMLRPVAVP